MKYVIDAITLKVVVRLPHRKRYPSLILEGGSEKIKYIFNGI